MEMKRRANRKEKWLPRLGAAALLLQLYGCAGMFDGLFGGKDGGDKPAALTEFKPAIRVQVAWQDSVGSAGEPALAPAVAGDSVFAAGPAGQLARYAADSGKLQWRINTGRKLSAGVGAGDNLVLAGTAKGEVLAYDANGQPLWQARVSSEVTGAPQVAGDIVVVRSGDGRIFALDARDGKRKWAYQRATPALTLRSQAGVVVMRGAVFAGFPGGKLVALKLADGKVGWEANVALPRGTTELERVADVAGLPVVDGDRVCAVAFQGRVACFDISSGNLLWARELSSSTGLAVDQRNVYVADERGAVHALDKASGASVWRQDKLFARGLSAPLALGGQIAVGDFEGQVHFLAPDSGAFTARLATDGSAVRAQPVRLGERLLVQTSKGGLYSIAIR